MSRDQGERTDRLLAADRARARAVEAGARAEALRERVVELKAAAVTLPFRLDPTEKALANAMVRRDEAAQRDRAAHDAAARAHDRAADTFAEFATTGSPTRRADYLRRMTHHREAAVVDREHGEHFPDGP